MKLASYVMHVNRIVCVKNINKIKFNVAWQYICHLVFKKRYYTTVAGFNILSQNMMFYQDSGSSAGLVELTGIKDLNDIGKEISQLQR